MILIIWYAGGLLHAIDTSEQQLLTALSGGRSIFQTARNGPIKVKHVPTGRMIPRSVNHPGGYRTLLVRSTSIQEAISKRASGVSARTTLYFCIIETSVYVAYWIFPRVGGWKSEHAAIIFPEKNSTKLSLALLNFKRTKSVRKTFLFCPTLFYLSLRTFLIRCVRGGGISGYHKLVAWNPRTIVKFRGHYIN